jgi:nucleoside-diphosphate-sugar epimerase
MKNLLPLLLGVFGSSTVYSFQGHSSHCRWSTLRSQRKSKLNLSNGSVLIVQNKGGGHGELGYQLSKILRDQYSDVVSSITILQDAAYKPGNEPFRSYAVDLPEVNVITAPLSGDDESSTTSETLQQALGGDGVTFDYVWDNASKDDTGAGKALVDCAKSWNVQLLCYVSSAGMYQPTDTFPMTETTPVKESAGQYKYEQYAIAQGLPLVSFRPQYIYGPKANKYDYIDWYFDRLVRHLPLPIPGDGSQLVSLSHSEDVATLLSSPLSNQPAAINQRFFNCGTDQLISYNELAYQCAQVAGIDRSQVMIENYDAKLLGKGTFPFRPTNFYVLPDKAKQLLGWKGASHTLLDDLKSFYYTNYIARGGPEKKVSFIKDWEIVVGCKTPPLGYVTSIYEKYDPLVLETM